MPKSECSIQTAINYAADRLRSLAAAHGITISVPNEDVIIAADENRMTRLIYNLLLNAVLHSESKHQVEINLLKVKAGYTIVVEDHGKGIPPEQLAHLFERFHRIKDKTTGSNRGAGLGLSIVKSIADHYGFMLSVISAEETGTTVSINIPQSAVLG